MSLSLSQSTISPQEMLQDTGRLLADVAEDLAIEILSEFTKEDYSHLGKTLDRLVAAASRLVELNIDVPFPVAEVVRNYHGSVISN